MTTLIVVACASLALASCDDGVEGPRVSTMRFVESPLSPTPVPGPQVTMHGLSFASVPSVGCPGLAPFATPFDLAIGWGHPSEALLDSVTIHLIDGTNVGGPSVVMPRPELSRMFGSTSVRGSRTFAFRPHFGCGLKRPQGLNVEVVVMDSDGRPHRTTAMGAFR